MHIRYHLCYVPHNIQLLYHKLSTTVNKYTNPKKVTCRKIISTISFFKQNCPSPLPPSPPLEKENDDDDDDDDDSRIYHDSKLHLIKYFDRPIL